MKTIEPDVKQKLNVFISWAQEEGLTKDESKKMLFDEWNDIIKQKMFCNVSEEDENGWREKVKAFLRQNYLNFEDFGNSLEHCFMINSQFKTSSQFYYNSWYDLTSTNRNKRKTLNELQKVTLIIEVAVAICNSSRESFTKAKDLKEFVKEIANEVEKNISFSLTSKYAQCALVLDVWFKYIKQFELEGWETKDDFLDLRNKFLVMIS